MTFFLSEPVDNLTRRTTPPSTHTVIVGSGYGAAMAALRLSESGEDSTDPGSIWVIERGKEYLPGEFPKSVADLPGHLVWTREGLRMGERDALFDLKTGEGASALVGSGLGGTSLINGGVAIDPPKQAFSSWPSPPASSGDWEQALAKAAGRVKDILGVTTQTGNTNLHPNGHNLGKVKALKGLACAADSSIDLVPLAINFTGKPNAVGINQPACIDCGNCVTGCNIGAKNTLTINVWPLVKDRGVKLYTGGTVTCISQGKRNRRWTISVRLTACEPQEPSTPGIPGESIEIDADRVILAAGTFGSTEILQQSNISTSPRLGDRFSVNGDVMAFGYRRTKRVDAAAIMPSTSSAPPAHQQPVGPLTTAAFSTRLPGLAEPHATVSIQDGAVPYPLRRIWAELLEMGHLARLFADGAEAKTPGADPLTVDDNLLAHSQLITGMGRELGQGSIRLRDMKAAPDKAPEKIAEPFWDVDETATREYYDAFERRFEEIEEEGEKGKTGFDGGLFLNSPPWRILPKKISDTMSGMDTIKPHFLSTHPLGGCCMATTAAEGVVNTSGQVFSNSRGADVHPELYVLDGAIIPGPIGVNPFMTIASLAYHLADQMATGAVSKLRPVRNRHMHPGAGYPQTNPADEHIAGTFDEWLFLDKDTNKNPGKDELREHFKVPDDERLVLSISIRTGNLLDSLSTPAQPLSATYTFARSTEKGDTINPASLINAKSFEGWVTLGGIDAPDGTLIRWFRMFRVGMYYLRLRAHEVWSQVHNITEIKTGKPIPRQTRFVQFKRRVVEFGKTIGRQARVQASWRYMDYGCDMEGVPFRGRKTLAFTCRQRDPLTTLRKLPYTLNGKTPSITSSHHLRVDLIRFTEDLAAFQANTTPNSVVVMLAMISTVCYFLRGIIQTHFWNFAAPSYKAYPDKTKVNQRRREEPPEWLKLPSEGGAAERIELQSRRFRGDTMRLTAYKPPDKSTESGKPRKIALLIHGLAHGSRVFWTETVNVNLAQHLLSEGFEVWLLDHRLSCNLAEDPNPKLSMDRIAAKDIPWAVDTVYNTVNSQNDGADSCKIRVFAHCIGAGAFAMAVLRGRLSEKIDSAVIHAVTPWLIASEDNRWRANAVSMFKSRMNDQSFDPIPHNAPSLLESMGDRLAHSFYWDSDELRLHRAHQKSDEQFSRTICNRMTLYYGDEWVHKNLDERTHENLHTLVGPAPIEVLKQVYHCIVKGRLTNREGNNEYVVANQIRKHWTFPTLFLHGERNKVFSYESTRHTTDEMKQMVAPALQDQITAYIARGYGHMDMLFGKKACVDVFGVIAEFLTDRLLSNETVKKSLPLEPTVPARAPAVPLTGPILSRPRFSHGRHIVRVWNQLPGYLNSVPAIRFTSAGKNLPAILIAVREKRRPSRLGEIEFVIHDLDITHANAPIEVHLEPPGPIPKAQPGSANEEPANDRQETSHRRMLDWQGLPWFDRAREQNPQSLKFVTGSCLFPGSPAEQELSDGIFAAIWPYVSGEASPAADHLLLMGDQIYADATAGVFDPAEPLERFRERYEMAFGGLDRANGANANRVMARIPTYFAVDDHEISNDWPRDVSRRRHPKGERYGPRRERVVARRSARNFLIHEEVSKRRKTKGRYPATPDKLWYTFESRGFPHFVFDTRTQREPGDRRNLDRLLLGQQLEDFEIWLQGKAIQVDGYPPTIVTGSPLGPVPIDHCEHPDLTERADSLLGHPEFLKQLTTLLHKYGQKEVLWLSGDAHLSCLADYTLTFNSKTIRIHHLVASGLYAPLPFANHDWSEFGNSVRFKHANITLTGSQSLLSQSTRHFISVTLDRTPAGTQLSVHACEPPPIGPAHNSKTVLMNAGSLRGRMAAPGVSTQIPTPTRKSPVTQS